MKASETIDSVKDKVRELLVKYPVLRDEDKKLWLAYLNVNFGMREKMGEEAYKVFKDVILDKTTPTMDTLTRARRKIQEKEVDLAGERRKERKEASEDVKNWALTT